MTASRMQRFLLMVALLAAPLPMMVSCGGNATHPAVVQSYNPAPAVVISGVTSAAATGPVTFTFTFSQPVSAFPTSAVTVTNGTVAASTTMVSANQYTLVINPTANATGAMTVSVAAGAFTSSSGVANTAGASVSQTFNTAVPPPVTTLPVFTDDYATGMSFAPFSGSVNAVTVDNTEHHSGTASLKVVVPGGTNYTGGAIVAATPKNLTGYTALTFWIKASKASVTLNVAGLGNNPYTNTTYAAESTAIPVTTSWAKYTIPIPDPSKATAMDGLFHFAEGPEDGAYTFWLDDIQYEALSGASAPAATGVTVTWTAPTIVAGSTSQLLQGSNTLAYSFPALANGGNLYNVGWGYFTLASNNTAVATVSGTGLVTGVGAGAAHITGTLGGLPAPGFAAVTVSASAFPTPATLPPLPAPPSGSSVISLYSSLAASGFTGSTVVDKSANVQTWLTSWSGAGATGGTVFPITVGATTANPRQYTMTNSGNYVGISLVPDSAAVPPNIVTTNEIDISSMTHFHVDFWTPDESTNLQFKVVDGGADGQINPGYDGILLLTGATTPALATGHWISCDVPFTSAGFNGEDNFPGGTAASLKHFAQMVIVAAGGGHVYVDNIYFWGPSGGGGGTATAPTAGAPAPTLAAASVKSLYTSSHTYTNVSVGDWNPNWGQGGTISDVVAGSVTVKKMDLVDYQGIHISSPNGAPTDSGVLDITGKGTLHISYWTANGTAFNFTPIDAGDHEYPIASGTLTQGAWKELELPITNAGFDLSTLRQLKFDTTTGEVIYLDNIYFHGASSSGDTAPTAGAPAPSLAAASVIPLYTSSHTYTNITVGDWNPNWGQGGTIADAVVGSVTVKLMNLVNYQGINISAPNGAPTDSGVINITGKNTLHISYWTANGTAFNFTPIDAGDHEFPIPSGALTQGAWTSLELPITNGGFDLATVRQLKFDTTTPQIIYLDNIYFH